MNFDFMWGHPARWLALGMGSGLVRFAPGTVGTLWAWALFLLLSVFLNDATGLWLIGLGFFVGCWACSRTAHELCQMDPSCIVWDEIIAFWMILCMIGPSSLSWQAIAFGLFRFFDAVKPGPVGWIDAFFKESPRHSSGWKIGLGIMLDDVAAAFCTLLVMALWQSIWG
jgi:phosphatidylglycerophosphatase A